MTAGSAAQAAYEAYSAEAGGKSLVSGDVLPEWGALSVEIQNAWRAAAAGVLRTLAGHRTWNT